MGGIHVSPRTPRSLTFGPAIVAGAAAACLAGVGGWWIWSELSAWAGGLRAVEAFVEGAQEAVAGRTHGSAPTQHGVVRPLTPSEPEPVAASTDNRQSLIDNPLLAA